MVASVPPSNPRVRMPLRRHVKICFKKMHIWGSPLRVIYLFIDSFIYICIYIEYPRRADTPPLSRIVKNTVFLQATCAINMVNQVPSRSVFSGSTVELGLGSQAGSAMCSSIIMFVI